LYGVYAYC